jgi:hypothetical protein
VLVIFSPASLPRLEPNSELLGDAVDIVGDFAVKLVVLGALYRGPTFRSLSEHLINACVRLSGLFHGITTSHVL